MALEAFGEIFLGKKVAAALRTAPPPDLVTHARRILAPGSPFQDKQTFGKIVLTRFIPDILNVIQPLLFGVS